MSARIERRIEVLEITANCADRNLRVVIAEPGESQGGFIARFTNIAVEMPGTSPGIPSVILRADDADRD